MTEQFTSVRVERANFCTDLDETKALVQRIKEVVGKSLSHVFTELLKMFEDMVHAVERIVQEDPVAGWKKINTHFLG